MIKVNGEPVEGAEGMTVADFLRSRGYPDRMIAVECNGRIVPGKEWAVRQLVQGDVVEVVRFVGGG